MLLWLCVGGFKIMFGMQQFYIQWPNCYSDCLYNSYGNMVLADFDNRAENFTLKPTAWKRLRDDVFAAWTHINNTDINNIDDTKKNYHTNCRWKWSFRS